MATEKVSSRMETLSSLIDDMHFGIVELCGPRTWKDNRDSWLTRGAEAAGISFRTARAFFYREASNPSAEAVERVRAAVARRRQEDDVARAEFKEVVGRLGSLLSRLESIDQEFTRPDLDGLRHLADQLGIRVNARGRKNGPMD